MVRVLGCGNNFRQCNERVFVVFDFVQDLLRSSVPASWWTPLWIIPIPRVSDSLGIPKSPVK